MSEELKVKQLILKPLLDEPGLYLYNMMDEKVFISLVHTIPEEFYLVNSIVDSTALMTLTGREPTFGNRKLKLAKGEAALVFEFDSAGYGVAKKIATGYNVGTDVEYVRKNSKFGLITRIG